MLNHQSPDAAEPEVIRPDVRLPPANTLELNFRSPRVFSFSWRPMRVDHYRLLERSDDNSGFEVLADNIAPFELGTEIELPLLTRLNASYKLQSCIEAACSDSNIVSVNTIDSDLSSAAGVLSPDDLADLNGYGRAVSVSGDGMTMAVGVPYINSDSGAVYIYHKNTETLQWEQTDTLTSSAENARSLFGQNVALNQNGKTIAVSALAEDAVYVFDLIGGTDGIWFGGNPIRPADSDRSGTFGRSIAISDSGSTIVVGDDHADGDASGNARSDLENAGAAYVFSRISPPPSGFFRQTGSLTASNRDARDRFGLSVDINGRGDKVIVGAPFEDSNTDGNLNDSSRDGNNNESVDSGAAYVFHLIRQEGQDFAEWQQESYLKAQTPQVSAHFGHAVSISDSGNRIAIGAPDRNVPTAEGTGDNGGAIWTYTFAGNDDLTWRLNSLLRTRFQEANDRFGSSVVLSDDGRTLAAGAPGESGTAAGIHHFTDSEFTVEDRPGVSEATGAAYIFRLNGTWEQEAYIRQTTAGRDFGNFGRSISLDDNSDTFVVGRPGRRFEGFGENRGAVYIY